MSSTALLLAATLVLGSDGPDSESPAPTEYARGLQTIRKSELRAWLEFLASPELEGRDSGTRGYDVASRYVATQMNSFGVQPGAADGSYHQRFRMVRRDRPGKESFLTLAAHERGDQNHAEEKHGLAGKIAVAAAGSIDWKEPWRFVGHGLGAASDSRDDFAGVDVTKTVVFILPKKDGDPESVRAARAAGAKKIVVVSDSHVRRRIGMRFRFMAHDRVAKDRFVDPDGIEIVYLASSLADKILARWQTSVNDIRSGKKPPRPVGSEKPIEAQLVVPFNRTESPTQNVVGILPGSDPELREEVVVIGAHLDHVGAHDDKIFYGADDDASGCVAVLAAAQALAENGRAPRRSVVFIFFGAEEKGLHGSRYWVDNPTVPIERVVAMFNLDMVGRNEEKKERKNRKGEIVTPAEKAEDNVNSLHVIGSKKLSLELDPWIHRVNEYIGFDFEYDEGGVWRRSDHYNFAEKGIPVAFFFAGFHPDYHQPTDTPDKVNYDKVTRVAKLVFSLAFEIADRPARLRVNRL